MSQSASAQAKDKLDVIIPVFNEQECLNQLLERLIALRNNMATVVDMNLIFINDGSKDNSLAMLEQFASQYSFVKVLSFSRNFGHQISLTAGLDHTNADYVAIIDADLQDPPELIKPMYEKAKEGFDTIYGQRKMRKGDSGFKKITASLFYRILSKLCDVEIPKDTGDFRLINNKVLTALKTLHEKHRFIRGMVPWLGFKSTPFLYDRDERFAGETKYPFSKMLKFALDAIFSFSSKPLKMATSLGMLMICVGLTLAFFMLYIKLFTDKAVLGVTVIVWSVITIGGIQILMLGVAGEYIARIFEESKNRPLYIIEKAVNFLPENTNK
jgi:polyisoprenyl-phosphate glycosyltransferase